MVVIRIDFIKVIQRRTWHIYWAIEAKKKSQMRIKETSKDRHLWLLQVLLLLKQVWTSHFYSHVNSQVKERTTTLNCWKNKDKGQSHNHHYLTHWAQMHHKSFRILSHPEQCQCSKTPHLSLLKCKSFAVEVLQKSTTQGTCQEELTLT